LKGRDNREIIEVGRMIILKCVKGIVDQKVCWIHVA